MTPPRLLAIELEGFRGFAKEQRLDLDADAVLIRGDNGSGKTSLVDGFLWVFCGELRYLMERVRKLRRNESIVQSRFTSAPARVALELEHAGHHYRFERSGGDKDTVLEGTRDRRPVADAEGTLAAAFGHDEIEPFRAAVQTWGLLRQDAVRAALDAAGGALHQRLASVIGLEQVSSFATAASATAKSLQVERTAARKAISSLRLRHEEAVQRHWATQQDLAGLERELPQLRADVAEASERLRPYGALEIPTAWDADTIVALGSALAAALPLLADLAARRHELAEAGRPVEIPLEAAERELTKAQRRLTTVSDEGPATARLARAALELLVGDACPVCGQEVRESELRAHLQEVAGSAERFVVSAQHATDAVTRAASQVYELRQEQRRLTELVHRERAAAAAAATSLEEVAALGLKLSPPVDAAELSRLSAELEGFLQRMRSLFRAASAAGGAHVDRLANEAAALQTELTDAEQELRSLEARYERAKTLERSAHEAAEKIVSRALEQLEPGFAEVFDRLNPNPAFTELRARQDVLRNVNQVVPMVRDPQRGIEANPLLVFSEGQLNVVALSYFLGMALNARDATLPFLILDDPLQALDTVAGLGFADLCRRIRDERQLLVTTHDRRFADILGRKLAPRESHETTLVHEFEGWTRSGPSIRTTAPEMGEVIPLLRRRAS